ncbi:hypothetical protein EVAR_101916_1 [Eumeta japonica]|uniref:Uncharacterized protein n=1 Tax=Eumeta variegata TaxID=151549 RepID=A0A4C1TSA6_EUMVA|nr:hypothetical protein EVAR_101916_1 [Eumeta japonica]
MPGHSPRRARFKTRYAWNLTSQLQKHLPAICGRLVNKLQSVARISQESVCSQQGAWERALGGRWHGAAHTPPARGVRTADALVEAASRIIL